jgi:Flavodoxin
MKTLIVYSTLGGASKKSAEILAENIKDSSIADIKKEVPDLNGIDAIIIGGGVYAAHIGRKLKKFVKKNLNKLVTIPHALFVCCADPDFMKFIKSNFPRRLVETAISAEGFGFEFVPERAGKFNFIFGSMLKTYQKNNMDKPSLTEERIKAVAEKFNRD